MNMECAFLADIGSRNEQQDRIAVLGNGGARLVALADGMGGHEGGALAAEVVIDVASEFFEGPLAGDPKMLLARICRDAHDRINAIGAERGMSPHSTCVLLHLTESVATWAHVGDSRLYRFEADRLVARTVDHSVVELMRLQGRITENEMRSHPDQNRLYEALGGAKPPGVEHGSATLSADDGFVLASDGLWENVDDMELEQLLESADLAASLSDLVETAKRRGGEQCDNISVAAVRSRRATPSPARRVRRTLARWRRKSWSWSRAGTLMDGATHEQALPAGCWLRSHRVEGVLGVGGLGVTCLASYARLGRKVAIKEYLPSEFAVRGGGARAVPRRGEDAGALRASQIGAVDVGRSVGWAVG